MLQCINFLKTLDTYADIMTIKSNQFQGSRKYVNLFIIKPRARIFTVHSMV